MSGLGCVAIMCNPIDSHTERDVLQRYPIPSAVKKRVNFTPPFFCFLVSKPSADMR